jgi:hypothetical protein
MRDSTDLRLALHSKAVRLNPEASNIREAITCYLAKLAPHSLEWDLWLDTYTEGELITKFGVDI